MLVIRSNSSKTATLDGLSYAARVSPETPIRASSGTDFSLGMRDTAARANVAEFILDCLDDDLYVRKMPKVADA